ncbi:MAG: PEP-CTERM sorting domain-containing protein [Burkholderiaceae bacterium]|nr:PEP-CTERM sorting domain-containing protein [Burkholderiaceae bacterium]
MTRAAFVAAFFSAVAIPTAHSAVTLVQTSDPGWYNDSIGTSLNGTNGGETGPFPVSDDASRTFASAPDLSAAGSALGNWLTDPGTLNANWSFESSIPNSWAVGTEVGVIYRFDTLGATNVVASFGVDNGIFVWLDSAYQFGARGPGTYVAGEYKIPLGDLAAGTHYLQLLLEDHGSTNGYVVSITADTFVPVPPDGTAPAPATLALLGLGLVGLRAMRKKA